jgi:hypothetical protein
LILTEYVSAQELPDQDRGARTAIDQRKNLIRSFIKLKAFVLIYHLNSNPQKGYLDLPNNRQVENPLEFLMNVAKIGNAPDLHI